MILNVAINARKLINEMMSRLCCIRSKDKRICVN